MIDRLIRISKASYSFGAAKVLEELDLDIKRGEFVAVVGPSGCGKTTLLNLIAGSYLPTRGEVERAGTARMVYQHDGLFPWLTAAENIALGLRHLNDQARQTREVTDLLNLTRLEDSSNYFPHQLSGGMRRRIELARVLAGESDLLLLDEPFSALDYQTRLHIRYELVRILKARPHTVVLVTHDIEEAAHLADRVLVLSDRPARLCYELRLDIERPRELTDPRVVGAVELILRHLKLGYDKEASGEAIADNRAPATVNKAFSTNSGTAAAIAAES
jgi:ABC-type nitrate/sulfonate/bicarbonate transport system ATPase subunit